MAEEKSEIKKIYRSRIDRFIGGVCGGLGEYFETDANVFRILFVVFTFVGGLGFLLYIAALIIVPENPLQEKAAERTEKDKTMFWAILLIVVGIVLLFRQLGLFDFLHFWHIPWSTIWAVFLIGIGFLLIFSANKNRNKSNDSENASGLKLPEFDKMHRSSTNRMLAGVCAGIAEYFKIDASLVRLLWVLATFASFGLGILVYIIFIFVLPEETNEQRAQ